MHQPLPQTEHQEPQSLRLPRHRDAASGSSRSVWERDSMCLTVSMVWLVKLLCGQHEVHFTSPPRMIKSYERCEQHLLEVDM